MINYLTQLFEHTRYALSSGLLILLFIITLFSQLSAQKHHPFLYWLVILATSTAGTTMSDYMDRTLGLGYAYASIILIIILIFTLLLWRYSTGSLAVSNVRDKKSELFYWFTILFSNTLGTAFGDFLADSSGLGFIGGALLIASLIALTILAYYYTKISHIILFWTAFVLTRPFGATFGDLLTKPIAQGGLNLGTLGSSIILATILVALIIFTSLKLPRKKLSSHN